MIQNRIRFHISSNFLQQIYFFKEIYVIEKHMQHYGNHEIIHIIRRWMAPYIFFLFIALKQNALKFNKSFKNIFQRRSGTKFTFLQRFFQKKILFIFKQHRKKKYSLEFVSYIFSVNHFYSCANNFTVE